MLEEVIRNEGDQVVKIEVDPNAYGYMQKFPWLLSLFIKFDSQEHSMEECEQFLDTKESLITFLQLDNTSKYVGSREIDGWSELYFYTQNSKDFTKKVAAFLQDFEYPFETNIVKDAKWEFFKKTLYPTEEEWDAIESKRIIKMLYEEGDDIMVPRKVEHYVYFDTPTQKERFVERLPLEGFAYQDEISTEDFENGVALVKEHNVGVDTIAHETALLREAIAPQNGHYALWSTTMAKGSEVEQ